MQMEPQVSLDCGACLRSNNNFNKDGTSGLNVTSPAQDHVSPQQPAKKQTRQWAAWTRQEEESFFTALRQFGKNFEKITSRVQSKNKDQVRHYYYRLVRRMNKLLGPELCLDAKNSKDTNAAMLRWWSLLEKYSCKASKLHLKPRRFKIFLDTLEHQLLKDRRKNIRKQRAQGEICSTTASATVYSQGKASLNDSRSVKVVLLDSQNIQKSGSRKGSSLKRNTNIGVNRSNCKGDSVSLKTAKLRQKPGTTAAYKRWEKAAIAGVSLVADAAAHLERTAVDEVVELVKETRGETGVAPIGKVFPSLPTLQNLFSENNVQNSTKLKLQLFPIDETTRRALEMDNHNPHLELTLSTRKKISSILEHLNRKWGKSSIACGELGLLPYCIQKENLVNCQRWTQDSFVSAADVYAQIGSPLVFRLRYCWFSNAEHEAATCQAPLASPSILDEHRTNMNPEHQNVDLLPYFTPPSEPMSDKLNDHCKDQVVSVGKITELVPVSIDVHTDMIECISTCPDKNILEFSNNPPVICWQRETCNVPIMRQVEEKDDMKFKTGIEFLPGEWADSLTNISMGDLLSEVPDNIDESCIGPSLPGSSQSLQQIPFSCDSFDAAIAALINKHQDKTGLHPPLELESHASSIWETEETCDAFSFQKNSFCTEKVMVASMNSSPKACEQSGAISLAGSGSAVEEIPEMEERMDDNPDHGVPMNKCQSDPHTVDISSKDLTGLSDLYWSESLGPLDLDVSSCKYHNEDLILSDSLSGLNRLIASSLDAFENCSFFGLDKIVSEPTVEAREGASFSDYKIGNEV